MACVRATVVASLRHSLSHQHQYHQQQQQQQARQPAITRSTQVCHSLSAGRCCAVVKLLSNAWWIPTGERLEGPKLELKGPRAEVSK